MVCNNGQEPPRSRSPLTGRAVYMICASRSTPRLDRQRVSRWVRAPGRPKYSDGDRERLRTPLNNGASWHAVSTATGIPQSTVQEVARAFGYPSAQSRAAQGLGKTSGLTACKTGFQIATAGSHLRSALFNPRPFRSRRWVPRSSLVIASGPPALPPSLPSYQPAPGLVAAAMGPPAPSLARLWGPRSTSWVRPDCSLLRCGQGKHPVKAA
jgi:hypothetical protein